MLKVKYRTDKNANKCAAKTVTEKLDVLRRSNGPVTLQPGGIPDLGLNSEVVELYSPCTELHADGCAAIMVKLVFCETR